MFRVTATGIFFLWLLIINFGVTAVNTHTDSTIFYKTLYDSLSEKYPNLNQDYSKIKSLVRWFDKTNDYLYKAKSHELLAGYYSKTNLNDSACFHYRIATQYYNQSNIVDNLAKVYNNMSTCQYYLGDYEAAKSSSLKALNYTSDSNLIAIIYTGLAMAYQELNKIDSALIFYNKAHTLYKEQNDSIGIAYQYLNIGTLYLGQEELAGEAKSYLLKAYEILKRSDDKIGLSAAINNLAVIYGISKNYKKQLSLYFEAYKIDSALNNNIEVAGDLNNIGQTYIHLKDTVKAIQYLNRAFSLGKLFKAKQLIAFSAYNLGELLLKQHQYEKARYYTLISLESSKKSNSLSDVISTYYLLSQIESKSGNYRKAFSYLSKYTNLYDSVFTLEKTKLLANAKEKYEAIEKQNKILTLEKQNLKEKNLKKILFISVIIITVILLVIVISFFSIQKSRNKIKKQQHYFQKLLLNSIEYTFVIDNTETITYVSPSFTKMFRGNKGDKLANSFYHNLFSQTEINKFKDVLQQIKNGRKKIEFELKVITINNDQKFITGVAQNFIDDELINGIIVNLWDITEIKEAEQKLQKREIELNESNKSKEKLFSIISHDLIGFIGTSSELMKLLNLEYDDLDKEMIKKIIRSVSDSLESTNTLITNLLSWSRIQMNQITTERNPVLLFPILQNTIQLYNEQLKNKSLEVKLNCERIIKVTADKNQLEIIFRNLLRNSIKFTGEGGTISINCEELDTYVKICFRDNGIGISPEQIKNILSFSNNIESTPGTNKEQGTGLGLIVTREFLQLNKGKLTIDSEPGKGTNICIMLLK